MLNSFTLTPCLLGDRLFPPQTGLSFSSWICVDKFSDPRTDPHCVRLLTLVRNYNSTRDEQLVCLSIVLSARDKAIIVSTQETHIPPRKLFSSIQWNFQYKNI